MHEGQEHLPLEYAVLAFISGWAWIVGVCLALFLLRWAWEMLARPVDKRSARERPFMTPELRKQLRSFH
jgi:hypothetical protein